MHRPCGPGLHRSKLACGAAVAAVVARLPQQQLRALVRQLPCKHSPHSASLLLITAITPPPPPNTHLPRLLPALHPGGANREAVPLQQVRHPAVVAGGGGQPM